MRVLFVITARGGSKGVSRKNIRLIGDLPLIAFKIISAQKTKFSKRIIVSTDDKEIAEVALKYGAEVPFMRPEYLASDIASSMDVVEHAMNWIKENDVNHYDYICLLEPSSPFATYVDLNQAIESMVAGNADTLVGVKEVEVAKDFIFPLDTDGGLSYFYESMLNKKSVRRQDQIKEYTMNGCMYVSKWDYFINNKLFHAKNSLPYIMPWDYSVEIDSESQLIYANYLWEKGYIDKKYWE